MKISYKRDMTRNYMVPDLPERLNEDDYRVHMLLENQIRGLLPCSIKKINCESRFFYDITSRQSMEHIYGKWLMKEEDILTFLRSFYQTLKEIRKYLLDADMLVLTPQAIYMDVETHRPWFCYLPGYHKSITESFQGIAGYILEHLDRKEERAVLLAYEIYRKAREEDYCLEKILKEALAGEMRKRENEREWEVRKDRLRERMPEYKAAREPEPEYQNIGNDRMEEEELYEYETKYKDLREQKTEKRRVRTKLPERGKAPKEKKSGQTFLCLCFFFAIMLAAAAAWLWGLSTAQIGGIVLLLTVLLVYGCSVSKKQKKQKNKKEKDREHVKKAWREAGYRDGDEEPEYEAEAYQEEEAYSRAEGRGAGYDAGAVYPAKRMCRANDRMDDTYRAAGRTDHAYRADSRTDAYRADGRTDYTCRTDEDAGYAHRTNVWPKRKEAMAAGFDEKGYFREYETAAENRIAENPPVYERYAGDAKRDGERTSGGRRTRLGDTGVLYEADAYEPTLILLSANPNSREAILLEDDCYIVGKLSSESDIVLKDPSVSRVHAKIERRKKGYYLCDLNSTNGTFLNGRRLEINESAPIRPSDEIAFAKVRYYVGKC